MKPGFLLYLNHACFMCANFLLLLLWSNSMMLGHGLLCMNNKWFKSQLGLLPVTGFFGFPWSLCVKVLTTLRYELKPIFSPLSPLFVYNLSLSHNLKHNTLLQHICGNVLRNGCILRCRITRGAERSSWLKIKPRKDV